MIPFPKSYRVPDPWEFLERDEDYVEDVKHPDKPVYFDQDDKLRTCYLEGSFRCVGCHERRPNSCGGGDETLISRVCDFCTVRTWDNLQRVCTAIAVQQRNSHA